MKKNKRVDYSSHQASLSSNISKVSTRNCGHIGFVTAKGNALYVSAEDSAPEIRLVGTNAGGWLLQEEYMCPVDFTQQEYEGGQYDAEKRLSKLIGDKDTRRLIDVYRDNWWKESDFDNILQMGMNTVRLPFGWRDLYFDDLSLREDAFVRLDSFIENAAKRGIYVILDLHGAYGSQSGKHHSGVDTLEENALLYLNDEYMNFNIELWKTVADRYKDNLSIAGYDLLNEPEGDIKSTGKLTCKVQWDYFDKLYRAVRSIDQNHLIIMESCWEPEHLPDPTLYGWTNICYEYHFYQWNDGENLDSQKAFFDDKTKLFNKTDHNVPVLVGEMCYFNNLDNWVLALSYLNAHGFSWTTWTYKAWCNDRNNWGLYRRGDRLEYVLTLASSSERIEQVFKLCGTENFERNDKLIEIVRKYALEANN